MQAFTTLTSLAAPLDRTNIDTDQIIPKQFLKRIERTGYGDFLFFDWRQTPEGEPVPEFVLNDPRFKGAQILIAGKNFGCGSSREHAAWALSDYGFRCVIAPTFADIFFSNAGKNGILLVKLSEEQVAELMYRAQTIPEYELNVSLEDQTVTDGEGFSASFEVDGFRRYCLLAGLDDIGLTLRHADALDKFEKQHDEASWLQPK
ncbi:3-isopropylmalate dehydratase small subunit [Occallatibacter riparius]|uniref:3-isopropylmalate dehydratase small subunit n=1 Tax=Occallatibacter riparius TaxID=1002689 RepID=A0A9J7BM82_9BACT|nr:3-isopropylmalate dehydratase small subunit [Occallatibacter riparius]UWZ82309.1 3-isopropylmalate dehydratase small subunit [Occallatibacter riparius]